MLKVRFHHVALILLTGLASLSTSQAVSVLPGSETSLQTIINQRVVNHSIDVNADQVASDAYWMAAQDPAAALIIEIAGYRHGNAFGIYNRANPNQRLQVFSGPDSAPLGPRSIAVPTEWASFGFYLANTAQNFIWYSDSALNAGGQLDHMVAYQGRDGASFRLNPSNPGSAIAFDSNDYLLAWEDLNLGDRDYNDMVVLVQNVSPAPVPEGGATAALLGLSLLGLGLLSQRYRQPQH
jgi:hypothetical protein